MAKKFNVCTKKIYTDNSGVEKTQWMRVGNLIQFPPNNGKPEGFKLELYMHPLTPFFIFEAKANESGEAVVDIQTGQVTRPAPNKQLAAVVPKGQKVEASQIEYPENDINPDDIPF